MKLLATLFTAFVALFHMGVLVLEMFFWDHPFGRKVFGLSEQLSADTVMMGANQGLYNGFLAAGIIWGLIGRRRDVITFFLICVIIAGIFGAATVKPTIFFYQSLPAIIALGLTFLAKAKA
jgi:putative membrane protein